ncbi:hypothetical protein LOZ80_16260 [Paenibacillus sp. HWE-109]|uniref:hypothetical protein n=1 Tax=Paenibacillus sp. HWE-109 TaxID=1306526 RepID=UPI001EDD0432|nr:hypothetical protein [Paenibacillus sp. HWE-109]UKS30402.1 hypothetical protein LOZ80_16260 [Paenibacillus sp. HWE-109]
MWSRFIGSMPSGLVILCALLSFVVPFGIYTFNQKLHEYGDPPWKLKTDEKDADGKGPLKTNE